MLVAMPHECSKASMTASPVQHCMSVRWPGMSTASEIKKEGTTECRSVLAADSIAHLISKELCTLPAFIHMLSW